MGYIAIFISLIYLLNGCKSSDKKTSQPQGRNADSLSQISPGIPDTFPAIPHPGPGLSPGQVKLQAEITQLLFNQTDSTGRLTLKVKSVEQYGASTPAVPANDMLNIFITDQQFRAVEEGDTIQVTLQHNISKTEQGDEAVWSLVNFKN